MSQDWSAASYIVAATMPFILSLAGLSSAKRPNMATCSVSRGWPSPCSQSRPGNQWRHWIILIRHAASVAPSACVGPQGRMTGDAEPGGHAAACDGHSAVLVGCWQLRRSAPSAPAEVGGLVGSDQPGCDPGSCAGRRSRRATQASPGSEHLSRRHTEHHLVRCPGIFIGAVTFTRFRGGVRKPVPHRLKPR